jgi:hypothetical protein
MEDSSVIAKEYGRQAAVVECVSITQQSTERTPAVGHSQQHNRTQYDMLPQHTVYTTKLISD